MASQAFSIYLLKENFNPNNSIREDYKNRLEEISKDSWESHAIQDSSLYLQKDTPKDPIWKKYFNIKEEIYNQNQGSILFFPISNGRYFAITFGYAYHAIIKSALEHNFGLITTLNALDPNTPIKTIDTVYLENNKKVRTQSPFYTSLPFFQFNKYESLVKSLQGKVKKEYQNIFNNITGTTSFKCTSENSLSELKNLCQDLFELFQKDDYKNSFPELMYIKQISDPNKIYELNSHLIKSIDNNKNITLSINDIIDPLIPIKFEISGIDNIPQEYEELLFENYLDYLEQSRIDFNKITKKDLENHSVSCINADDNNKISTYSIYECISFEIKDSYEQTYYLYNGNWYKINQDYIQRIKNELDPIFIPKHPILDGYSHNNENDYNQDMSKKINTLCLDKKNISPKSQTQIEPCDIISLQDDALHFIHIKRETKSCTLSHLFNQGINSIKLIRAESKSKEKLQKLIGSNSYILNALDQKKFKIIYGIITHKAPNKRSDNLPLFSRISLLHIYEECKLLGIACEVIFIPEAKNTSTSNPN